MNSSTESFDEAVTLTPSQRKLLWGTLVALIILRILLMIQVPFTDTTEARYAEMARKMAETGDWVTPQIEYGVPFWGKPPLHTWLAASGMKLFGVNEFGGRIFIFFTGLSVLGILYRWAQEYRGKNYALLGVTMLTSSALFFIAMACVMTDLVMLAGTTLSMVAFWSALDGRSHRKLMGYLFFVGLAIGLLAKGPVAFVLTALPIGAWVLIQNRWRETWRNLPWISGTILMLLLSLPWYLIAEQKTPGFLSYFIVGEHFERFLMSGWKGDLYGSGHAEARGTIWLFWLATLLPWTFFFLAPLGRIKSIVAGFKNETSLWSSYLLCWALAPLVFFTMATNIIPTYVITGIPASCFLIIDVWLHAARGQRAAPAKVAHLFKGSLASGFFIFLGASIVFSYLPHLAPKRTQKDLVVQKTISEGPVSLPLYYFGRKNYSIEFYTKGKAIRLGDPDDLAGILTDSKRDFVSIDEKTFKKLNPNIQSAFFQHGKFRRSLLLSDRPQKRTTPLNEH
ncbi:MAG: 4-amino-4-deoxy-L-arabinose transferase-like glycosyltransferase [Akkermansiaceae bacterium]|jgi:4-amino-4-deoxy-L-arabinose transferase-like glycosyltransferase